jgi:hypothetical protein
MNILDRSFIFVDVFKNVSCNDDIVRSIAEWQVAKIYSVVDIRGEQVSRFVPAEELSEEPLQLLFRTKVKQA